MEDLIDNFLGRHQRNKFAAAAAEAGILPQIPNLKAPTHQPWLEAAAKLFLLVALRDLDAIKAWHPLDDKPGRKVQTSTPDLLLRYRDNVIAALEAQARAAKRNRDRE